MILFQTLVGVTLLWGLYMLPTLIAVGRHHPSRNSIAVVNLFLGWTLIAWIICLAWAVSPIPQPMGHPWQYTEPRK